MAYRVSWLLKFLSTTYNNADTKQRTRLTSGHQSTGGSSEDNVRQNLDQGQREIPKKSLNSNQDLLISMQPRYHLAKRLDIFVNTL